MNTELVISEIAKRHQVRVERADPALVTMTIIELGLEAFAKKFEDLLKTGSDQMTLRLAGDGEASTKALVEAVEAGRVAISEEVAKGRKATGALMNEAGNWSAAQLKRGSELSAENIDDTVKGALARAGTLHAQAVRASQLAIWAAACAVSISLVLTGGGFGFWLAGK